MSLVIYLGWHVFKCKSNAFTSSEAIFYELIKKNLIDEDLNDKSPFLLEALDHEVIGQWLSKNTNHEIVLLWPQPHAFVSSSLAKGLDPEQALIQWQKLANTALALFRSHRRQVTLVGAAPGEKAEKFQAGKIGNFGTQLYSSMELESTPFYRLASAQLVENDNLLQYVLNYLTASSKICFFSSVNKITDEILAEIKAFEKLKNESIKYEIKLTQKIELLQEENEIQLQQLHYTQEALEEACFINNSSQVHQQEIHHLKSLIVWLRAHAYRQISGNYRKNRNYRNIIRKQVDLIESCDYFDAHWYLSNYTDVRNSSMNPAEHYLKFGAIEGRNPSPRFHTEFYLVKYADVAISGQHPLLHYLRYGINEQRETVAEVAL